MKLFAFLGKSHLNDLSRLENISHTEDRSKTSGNRVRIINFIHKFFLFMRSGQKKLHSVAEPSDEGSDASEASRESSFAAQAADERGDSDQSAFAVSLNCQWTARVSVAGTNVPSVTNTSGAD
jgi:hypothetical protein